MTNATAKTVAWTTKYDPFGNAVAVTAAIANNTRLPGQVYQIEDGLSYNWHRTYDPTIGRYTQADPLGFVDGPNIYNYAGQSPVMGVDPSGRFAPIAAAIACARSPLCRGIVGGAAAGGIDAGWQYWKCGVVDWPRAIGVGIGVGIGLPVKGFPKGFGGGRKGGGGPKVAGGGPKTNGPAANNDGPNTGNGIGILRDASRGKGNYGLGSATRRESDELGDAWVGPGSKVSQNGRAKVSGDGLRQYRSPTEKGRIGKTQSNFESRSEPKGPWQNNGHLDITE